VEEFRSLSGEELSLHKFLLDQILLLRESLEPCLVPRIVEKLLGTKLVTPSLAQDTLVLWLWWARWQRERWSLAPLTKDTLCPPTVVAKVVEGCSVVICAPPSLSGNASVVVREPTGAQVLLSPSQMPETRLSSI
jgi:hypothetical protein